MPQNIDLIEPDYWMRNHGRALRTTAEKTDLFGRRNEERARSVAKKLSRIAWSYPEHNHRGLIRVLLAQYGK